MIVSEQKEFYFQDISPSIMSCIFCQEGIRSKYLVSIYKFNIDKNRIHPTCLFLTIIIIKYFGFASHQFRTSMIVIKGFLIMQGRLLNIFVLGIYKIERSCSTILRVKSYVNATVWKLFALLRSYAYQDTIHCTKWLLNMIVC